MLHSECNKVVPFFCRLFFRVPPYYLPSNEVPPSLKSLATPLDDGDGAWQNDDGGDDDGDEDEDDDCGIVMMMKLVVVVMAMVVMAMVVIMVMML